MPVRPAWLQILAAMKRNRRRAMANVYGFSLAASATGSRLNNISHALRLFNREAVNDAAKLKHTTLAIARLRFLFIAAKIWRHAGRTGIHYSDQYQEQGLFQRLMTRLRAITMQGVAFRPVLHPALK